MFTRRVFLCLSATLTAWLLGLNVANAALVAYWNFDTDFNATAGGSTYDVIPTSGASINGVQSKWGGGAAHFDKALQQYATTTASPVPAGTYSYSHWYYLDVAQTSFGPDREWATINTGGPDDNWTLFYNVAGDDGAEPGNEDDFGVGRVKTDGPGLGQSNIYFPFPRPTNHQQWVNFIATVAYDPVTNTTTLEGFYNGVSLGFTGYGGSQQITTGKPVASTYLAFGVDRGLVSRFWEGYIDDVAVYDHVLTAQEIAALQTGPAGPTSGTPGDFDGDGDVDGADFVVWQTNFPKASGGTLDTGDADGDGDVDGADFVVWQTNFPFTPSPSIASVPEPNAFTLSLLGLAALVWQIRWRSRRG